MSDFLSQDDIDSLLSSDAVTNDSEEQDDSGIFEKILTDFNAQQSSVINTLIGKKIDFEIKEFPDAEEAQKIYEGNAFLRIELPLSGAVEGSQWIYIEKSRIAMLADLMVMGDGTAEYNEEEHLDAIKELYSAVNGGYASQLGGKAGGTVSSEDIVVSPSSEEPPDFSGKTALLEVAIKDSEPFDILIEQSQPLYEKLSELFGGSPAQSSKPDDDQEEDEDLLSQDEINSLSDASSQMGSADTTTSAQPRRVNPASQKNIDMLLDIDLDISIELGKTEITIKRVLDMAPGSMVELDNFAGEPVNLLVNNKVVAKGEVVVVDENFGVRIISLVSPEERIKSLR
ncbi:MAG: flagellar motor switch protein FliN [Fibrobacterota bacterium]